jgi:quinoprotein glucose dehydrogenase
MIHRIVQKLEAHAREKAPPRLCFELVSIAVTLLLLCPLPGRAQYGVKDGQWRSYAGDTGSTKYSALDLINKDNVKKLEIAWRWKSPDNAIRSKNPFLVPFIYEATPLLVNGVLYTSTSFAQIAAIDPATGETKWVYDPGSHKDGMPTNLGFVNRGVAYWTGGKDEERIFVATGNAHLVAVSAKDGKPCADFGKDGKVDLTKGLRRAVDRKLYSVTSAPLVCRDVVIVGSSISDLPPNKEMPPGDVRGFDPKTGKQLWTFQTVPQAGEVGVETWEKESWKYTGNTNVWAPMSADEETGYVYLPVSTPTNDWYGGHRHGDNLFADSLVCVEAKSGKRVWHFQTVHHGLWDYDLPAAPNLVDITVAGKKIKAVAQVTKQGFCFVFDRATGKPVWPIEEREVPRSKVPGEKAAPTQPFPTKPPPFERQGIREEDLIDFTPEMRKEALAILQKYEYGPLYTPPSEKGTVNLPGWLGGANWQGAAFDPETGILYVTSVTSPITVAVKKTEKDDKSGFDYLAALEGHLDGPQGLPLVKPPYGRLTAINLNKGEHAWMVPLGDGPRNHPLLKDLKDLPARLGSPQRGSLLCTKTLLFSGQQGKVEKVIGMIRSGEGTAKDLRESFTFNPYFRAFDKVTGEMLWEMKLPDNPTGAPMTYKIGDRQYIVFAVGGLLNPAELIALALPRE